MCKGYFLNFRLENSVMEKVCFVKSKIPRGDVCFESRSVFPCWSAKPGYCSHWLYCVERGSSQCCCVLTKSYFHSPAALKSRVGKKHAHSCPLTSPCTPIRMSVQSAIHTHTHTHTHKIIQCESLGTEQWNATAQDVYVISRVCEKLFAVAVETKCKI